jgi:tetratricopeptide (TPR) repeat protein
VDGRLFALWLVSVWSYHSVLPYWAPRYFVLAALPLVACAAWQVHAMLSAEAARVRALRGVGDWLPLTVWIVLLGFAAVDAVKHYVAIALAGRADLTTTPEALAAIYEAIETVPRNLAWGLAVSTVFLLTVVVASRRRSRVDLRKLALTCVALALVVNAGLLAWAMKHRTYRIEHAKESLAEFLGEGAVVLGGFAPLLAQDTEHSAIWYVGSLGEEDPIGRFGVTHLLLEFPRDVADLDARYPGLLKRLERVQTWPFRTIVRRIELFRLPDAEAKGYRLTPLERAVAEMQRGDCEVALRLFEQIRAERTVADVLAFEASCLYQLGRDREAEALFLEALALRPENPLLHQNLGILALQRGDREAARDRWLEALRIDPGDERVSQLLHDHRL